MGVQNGHRGTAGAESAAPDRSRLRRVAEEVRSGFPRPFFQTDVVLVDIDPGRLFAFWNIPLADYQKVARQHGFSGPQPQPFLRLMRFDGSDAASGTQTEIIPVGGLQSRVYLEAGPPGSVFQAEIGFTAQDGSFNALAKSNVAALPFPAPQGRSSAEPLRKAPTWKSPEGTFGVLDALAVYAAVPEAVAKTAEQGLNGTASAGSMGADLPQPSGGSERTSFPLPPGSQLTFTPPSIAGRTAQPVNHVGSAADGVPGSELNGGSHAARFSHAPVAEGLDNGGAGSHDLRALDGNVVVEQDALVNEPLALETVLPLSSFIFTEGEGGVDVALEVVAEVHLHGRAKPGMRLELFGEAIPLRPDGTFWVRRLLPRDPALLTALFASRDGWRRVDG